MGIIDGIKSVCCEEVTFLRFHPLTKDLILGYNMLVFPSSLWAHIYQMSNNPS